jgi:hypothetical protein
MHDLHRAGELPFPDLPQCLSSGGLDLRLEALHAARKEPACGELGIRGVSEQLAALPI